MFPTSRSPGLGRDRPRAYDRAVRPQRGSASVELAAVLPFAAVIGLVVVQIGLVVAAQLVVTHAAREGARAAAVHNDDALARDAAIAAGRLDPDRTEVTVEPAERGAGDPVTVTVRYRVPIVVPFVERFVPAGLALTAGVTMRTERETASGG